MRVNFMLTDATTTYKFYRYDERNPFTITSKP